MIHFIVFFTSISIFVISSLYLRDSSFDGLGSDALKQVRTASNHRNWGLWPSGMHKFAEGKSWMKDAGVLFILIFQKITGDIRGFYPVVLSSNFAHLLCGIFIFYISLNFFDEKVSLWVYLIYLTSFWSWMIVSHGGLQVVGQAFLLASILTLPFGDYENNFTILISYFLSGVFFAAMNFSSASSRKFLIIYPFFLLVSLSSSNNELKSRFLENFINIEDFFLVSIYLFGLLILIITSIFKKRITKVLYSKKYPFKFENPKNEPVEFYQKKVGILLKNICRVYLGLSLLVVVLAYFLNTSYSYLLFLTTTIGTVVGFLFFLLPNLKFNISGYFLYWVAESDWGSHYQSYEDYFKKNYGKVFLKGEEGIRWYLKFYLRMLPIEFLLLCSFSLLLISKFLFYEQEAYFLLCIFIISLSPIFWGEITIGPKAALPLYPSFIGFILITAFFLEDFLINSYFGQLSEIFLWIVIILIALRNLILVITDIFPSRLTVKYLFRSLKKRNIKTFITLSTEFNNPFIEVLKYQYPDQFNIEYLENLNEYRKGVLFLPCLSKNAPYYQSSRVGRESDIPEIEIDNFFGTDLFKSNIIRRFKTLGASNFWRLMGNVSAFRDLVLNEVPRSPDPKRYAWLLEIKE